MVAAQSGDTIDETTLKGSFPRGCPDETFDLGDDVDYLDGSELTSAEVVEWVEQ